MSASSPEPSFILDLSSRSGRRLLQLPDDEGAPPLHQWTTWLRIRSDVTGFVPPTINPDDDELTGFVPPVFERDGLALLTTLRSNQDLDGHSIGLFHGRLDAEELARLREVVENTPWADLPRPTGGDFNAPRLELSYVREGRLIRRAFNARNHDFIEAIGPLWRMLDKQLVRVRKSAATSLELQVSGSPTSDDDPRALRVRASLRVRGIGPVVLTDPRLPAREGDPPRLRVRIGEQVSDNPHARARGWVDLAIPAAPVDGPRSLVLRPPTRFELELSWLAPGPGRYLIEARWEDYRGPIDAVRGQTPFMPLAAVGPASLGSGPYPLRGAVFAARQITVE